MLEVLTKHLTSTETGCVTAQWIATLSEEEQKAFALTKENNEKIRIAHLYTDLSKEVLLPFKLTAFRSHLRGYCSCR
jgi:hypothetical protein